MSSTLEFINQWIFLKVYTLGYSWSTTIRIRNAIVGSILGLMALILLGNLVKILIVLAMPNSVLALAQL